MASIEQLPGPPPEDEQDPPGDPESVARAVCLRLLTARARTRAELADALRRRGVPDEAATAVLDRFTDVGLIDDAAFAETYALAAHRDRGLAARAVAAKLRLRGVAEAEVQAAVGLIDRDSELAAARALAGRRLRTMGRLEPQVQARRIFALLGRRGYNAGVAGQVVRELVSGSSGMDDVNDEPDNVG